VKLYLTFDLMAVNNEQFGLNVQNLIEK